MARPITISGKLAIDACRRWPQMPDATLAKYLAMRHPQIYTSEDNARTLIRRYRGHKGKQHRHVARFTEDKREMPQSIARDMADWKMPSGKWLLIGDVHVPLHDEAAIERAFGDAKRHKITGIFIGGDLQDSEGVGFFENTTITRDFCREVEYTIDFLDYMRAQFPKAEIIWQPGNHEERNEVYYRKMAPVLADLPTADMRVILDVESRGITLLQRRQRAVVQAKHEAGNLWILHGHTLLRGQAMPVSPARTGILRAKANVCFFHVHRQTYQPEPTIGNRTLAAWSIGCLCHLKPDYNRDANNWEHGHALLDVCGYDWELTTRRHLRDGRVL